MPIDLTLINGYVQAAATKPKTVKNNSTSKVAIEITPKPNSTGQDTTAAAFELPPDVNGALIVSVDSVKYRDGLIRDVLLNADISEGRLTLRQLSAGFPGGSETTLSGTLSADKGKPSFKGKIDTTINDLRGVLTWLGTDIASVPQDRLRKLQLSSQMSITPEFAQITGIDLRFDSSRLTGAATIALRKRPSFGLNIKLDRINLDAYLPKSAGSAKFTAPVSKQKQGSGSQAQINDATVAKNTPSPFKGLSVLGTFDANIKAQLKSLVVQGEKISNVAIDATLFNSNLEIRRLAIGRFAGVSASINGNLSDLTGLPKARDLKFTSATKNLVPLLKFVGVDLGIDARELGAFSQDTTVNGNLLKPFFKTEIKTAGARINASGKLSVLPVSDMFDLKVSVKHKSLTKLARAFGSTYRPSGKIGGLDVSMQVRGNPKAINLSNIKGKIGTVSVAGDAALDIGGIKPLIKANLRTGPITIDPYLPATKNATLKDGKWGPLKTQPVVWFGSTLKAMNPFLNFAAMRGRWPADPIDLSGLNAVNADINLTAPVIIFDKYLIEKADLGMSIKDGVLNTHRLTGNIFGGSVNATLSATSGRNNLIGGRIKVAGIQIAEALRSVIGEASADGNLTVDLNVNANGRSVADFIATLGGTGAFNMTDVDVSKQTKGSVFAGVYGLVSALNQFGAGKKSQRANIGGSFVINNGVAQTKDLKLTSGLGNGVAGGTIDLPNWKLNINGQFELVRSALSQLIQSKLTGGKSAVPFSVTGSLDQPDINVDMGAAIGSAIPIPGADLLLNKAPKGLGNILKGILGGGSQQTSSPPPAGNAGDTPPPPKTTGQQPEQQKTLSPKDLLDKIFKF